MNPENPEKYTKEYFEDRDKYWKEREKLEEVIGEDLFSALNSNGGIDPTSIEKVLARIDGENDGPEWHWLLKLKDGRFAYAFGGCDYTGWDCQSSLNVNTYETLEDAVFHTPSSDHSNRNVTKSFELQLAGEMSLGNFYSPNQAVAQ